MEDYSRCRDCGRRLTPCPAWVDGEATYVGYYPCECNAARMEDRDRDDWLTDYRAMTNTTEEP